jgi:hypothetical protein
MSVMRRVLMAIALCAATLVTLQAYRALPMQAALQDLLALCGH